MGNNNLTTFSFDQIVGVKDSFSIQHFIAPDSTKFQKALSFDHPFAIEGLIMGICIKGSATIKINFRDQHLSPNTIFTIFPNQILETVEKSDDLFIEVLIFSIDFFVDLPLPKDFDIVDKISKYPCLNIPDDELEYLLELYSFIAKSFNRKKHVYTDDIVKSLLLALIKEISSIYADEKVIENIKPSSRNEELTEQFFKLLFDYHRHERAASFYSGKLCVTTKYLSSVLKKVTGKSINSWIDKIVIASAKVLLKSTEQTVLQISEELNFSNPSFFGRFFKQHAGMTPLEYRES